MSFSVIPLSNIDIEKEAFLFLERHKNFVYTKKGFVDLSFLLENAIYVENKYHLLISDDLPEGIEAQTIFTDRIVQIRVKDYENINKRGRSRFSIAHELGHVKLHSKQMETQKVLAARTYNTIPRYKDSERQADYFAGALLMPLKLILGDVVLFQKSNNKEEIIKKVSKKFKVSEQSARVRLEKVSFLLTKKGATNMLITP